MFDLGYSNRRIAEAVGLDESTVRERRAKMSDPAPKCSAAHSAAGSTTKRPTKKAMAKALDVSRHKADELESGKKRDRRKEERDHRLGKITMPPRPSDRTMTRSHRPRSMHWRASVGRTPEST